MREGEVFDDNAPDWRWELVRYHVEERVVPSRRSSDTLIRIGYNYLKRRRQPGKAHLATLRRDYPDMFEAHSLRLSEASEKWIVEAALLTDTTFFNIADFIARRPSVVQMYADMFYDVRSRLKSRGYILNRILLPAFSRGLHARDYDFLFKTLAYCCGWDTFKDYLERGKLNDASRELLEVSFKDNLLRTAWAATQRIELNSYNAIKVMELATNLMSEQNSRDNYYNVGDVGKLVGDLLSECKLTISSNSTGPKELRAIEMLGKESYLHYGDPIPISSESLNKS